MPVKSHFRHASAWTTLITACGAAGAADTARDYPQRPIRLVSGFPAGGSSDLVARMVAPPLSARLGQNIVVENRGGAGGMIGSDFVAKATPDGHTLLFLSGAFTSQAAVVGKLPYDPLQDFAWISMVVTYPFVIVVKADSPLQTVSQLIAAARQNPGKLNYASVGIGSVFHLAAELFNSMAGTEMTHVPFKGGAEPMTELMAGRIDVTLSTLTGVYQNIQANRLRAIAVASLERAPQLPDVPTVADTLPGYEVISFNGFGAPRATPPAIIARLNREIRGVLADAELRRRLTDLGGNVRPNSPEEMHRHVAADIAKWRRIVAVRKIQVE